MFVSKFLKNTLRFTSLLIICVLAGGCPQDDDGLIDNPEDILGIWYRIDFCDEQNQLILNQNFTYTFIRSENIDCNTNDVFTVAYTGTYRLNEIEIVFKPESLQITPGEDGITPDIDLVTEEIWGIGFQNDSAFTAIILSVNGAPRDYDGTRLKFFRP